MCVCVCVCVCVPQYLVLMVGRRLEVGEGGCGLRESGRGLGGSRGQRSLAGSTGHLTKEKRETESHIPKQKLPQQ